MGLEKELNAVRERQEGGNPERPKNRPIAKKKAPAKKPAAVQSGQNTGAKGNP